MKRDAFELTAIQAKLVRKEFDHSPRRGQIPLQPAFASLNQILKMSATGIAHMRPGDNLSLDHGAEPKP